MRTFNNLQKANKAYVPVVVAILLIVLSSFGITSEMTVEDFLTYVVASIGVYLIPNRQ